MYSVLLFVIFYPLSNYLSIYLCTKYQIYICNLYEWPKLGKRLSEYDEFMCHESSVTDYITNDVGKKEVRVEGEG